MFRALILLAAVSAPADSDSITITVRGVIQQQRGEFVIVSQGESCRTSWTAEQRAQLPQLVGQRVTVTSERIGSGRWLATSIVPVGVAIPAPAKQAKPAPQPILTVEATKPVEVSPSPSDKPVSVGGVIAPKVESEE